MRTIDTNLLKSLGPNGSGPWRMGEDKLLRVRSGNHLIRTEDKAKEMLDIYRTCAAVAHTPQGHEAVRLGDGFGVVVDYVGGLGLGIHIALRSYSPSAAGRDMGKLLHGLHESSVEVAATGMRPSVAGQLRLRRFFRQALAAGSWGLWTP